MQGGRLVIKNRIGFGNFVDGFRITHPAFFDPALRRAQNSKALRPVTPNIVTERRANLGVQRRIQLKGAVKIFRCLLPFSLVVLCEMKTEKILWRSTFDLKYEKLLTLQDEVARIKFPVRRVFDVQICGNSPHINHLVPVLLDCG